MSQTEQTLNTLFDEAYELLESFDKRDDPSNSLEYQVRERSAFNFEKLLIVYIC